jgi:hypothetical protein
VEEFRMKHRTRTFVVLALIAAVAGLATDASAQWYRRYKRVDVDRALRRAEQTSDEFIRVFDRNLDESVLDKTEREDKLNEKARDLERRLDELRGDFDPRGNSWWESRETAAEALRYAKGINNSVRARRYTPRCEQMWRQMRSNLNDIARYFNLERLQS